MRKIKDSGIDWIGEVPYNWRVVPIKSFLSKKKEILEKWTGENVLSLTMNGVVIRNLENPSGKMPTTFDGYQKIDKGSLILCLFDIDVTPRCVGIAYNDGVTSPAYSQYRIINGNLKFYYYLLLMMDNDKILLPYSRTLRSTLTDEYFGAVKVAIPPLSEQEKIAQFLDKKIALIDDIITDTKTSIEELKAYKQSLITEIVTKGLDPTVKFVPSGIQWVGNVPEGWGIIPLKYCVSLDDNKVSQEEIDADLFIKYVEIGAVDSINGISNYQEMGLLSSPSRARKRVKEGDTIVSTVRTYLKAITTIEDDENVVVSTGFAVLRPNDKILPEFLGYAVKSDSFTENVVANSYGISYPAISAQKLISLPIVLPSIEEQSSIASYLDNKIIIIDKMIMEKENIISEYHTYKKSLIYEYVTGKKQVGANEG
ncbi:MULTISPECIES: restriction endonuclease subunit S [Streptococcus]|uniref:Restriction endonuclease subunit S n=1 Tax=Streptococcus caledonicus TaxID=2614158 RepID=A0ABW0UEG8_9STRE|nr:restriction endonuclease subunit S [Streptococcus sp. S784/96/1]